MQSLFTYMPEVLEPDETEPNQDNGRGTCKRRRCIFERDEQGNCRDEEHEAEELHS